MAKETSVHDNVYHEMLPGSQNQRFGHPIRWASYDGDDKFICDKGDILRMYLGDSINRGSLLAVGHHPKPTEEYVEVTVKDVGIKDGMVWVYWDQSSVRISQG